MNSGSYEGNCNWWLRTPENSGSNNAWDVSCDGGVYGSALVLDTGKGVLPALIISL